MNRSFCCTLGQVVSSRNPNGEAEGSGGLGPLASEDRLRDMPESHNGVVVATITRRVGDGSYLSIQTTKGKSFQPGYG